MAPTNLTESATADLRTDLAAGEGPEPTPRRRRAPKSPLRRRMTRTLQVIVAVFLLNYVVLPQIAGFGRAVKQLSTVNAALLLLGVGLELAAFFAYSKLTQAALTPSHITAPTLTRIQLATKAVTNVVPGGSAAGTALGYRLLTLAGAEPSAAGFALATAGLGSAVVLNLLLWSTLLISIPISGVNPIYVSVALVGIFVLGAFGVVVVFLVRGAERADRIVQGLARRFSFVDPAVVSGIIRRLGGRIRLLATNRRTLLRLVGWSLANWLLDASALWVFLRAFGVSVRPDSLIVAFCIANVLAAIPITPGGLGVIEVTLTTMLTFFGVPSATNAIAVNSYRLAAYWLPIPLGAAAYLSLRVGPWRVDRKASLRRLRDEAGPMVDTGESVYDWINRNTAQNSAPRVVTVPGGTVIINAQRAAEVGDADQVSTIPMAPMAPKAPTPASMPVVPDDLPEELS